MNNRNSGNVVRGRKAGLLSLLFVVRCGGACLLLDRLAILVDLAVVSREVFRVFNFVVVACAFRPCYGRGRGCAGARDCGAVVVIVFLLLLFIAVLFFLFVVGLAGVVTDTRMGARGRARGDEATRG